MLPRKMRITRNDFLVIAKKRSKRAIFGDFSLSVYPDTVVKITCIVSKKYVKNAVSRHKIKRWVYHSVLKHTIGSGAYVFAVKNHVSVVKFKDIQDVVEKLLQQI